VTKEDGLTDTQTHGPAFEGLILEQNEEWHYHFWYPKGWSRYDLTGDKTGVLCSPNAQDPTTYFSVETLRLPVAARPEDVDTLRQGIEEGLSSLPDLKVDSADDSSGGARLVFERLFTFRDGEMVRKRRIRLMYVGATLYSLTAQGEDEHAYEYWLSMLNYSFRTFELGLFDMGGLTPDS
jgi:hypothetical protein